MKTPSRSLACLLMLCAFTTLAATDDKPPILQNQPKVGDVLPPALSACGADWKRIHLTPTSVTCEFKPRGAACGDFGAGTPLNDGSGRHACAAPTVSVLGAGTQTRKRLCGSGWRVEEGSRSNSDLRTRWQCEPDPGGIRCPSGWSGPNRNQGWDRNAPLSMVCQLPPR